MSGITVHFLGGADEVGASCVLVEMGGQRILVDAGIRVSPKARDGLSGEMLPDLSPLSFNRHLDAVIITHAHTDHIGAIPLVLGSIPDVPVYATPATISLMSVMFRDALRVMESRMEAEGELPNYDQLQVQKVESACRPVDFRQEFSINGAVNVTFYRSGHIPGAGSVFLESDEGSILISGDLSFSPMRATPEAEVPPVRPNLLVLESTYGGKLHANRRAEEARLIESVMEVISREGRVLIPAFALGRAQEVALILDAAIASKKMLPVPIYMDGMTRSITRVFERFPDYLSKGLQRHLDDHLNIFKSTSVEFIRNAQHREEVAMKDSPAVIISSSGMLTGGASPYYAQQLVGDKRNAIYITGYQDEEAPGRALQRLAQEGAGSIMLYGKRYALECEIGTYSLSAHADENELTQFASQLEPDRILMVHGDGDARLRMRDLVRQRQMDVRLPRLGEVVEFSQAKPLGKRKSVPQALDKVTPDLLKDVSLEDLEIKLPLFDAENRLYNRNAKKMIRMLLPPERGLRKMTFNQNDNVVKLYFDFPDVAQKNYAQEIAQVMQMMEGWTVDIHPAVNTQALQTKAKQILGDFAYGRASIHQAEHVVEIGLTALPDNWRDVQKAFQDETGFRLIPKGSDMARFREQVAGGSVALDSNEGVVSPAGGVQMEINQAYAILREAFTEYGMYKAGLKNGQIVLSFVTPEQGERLKDEMEAVAQQIGYGLRIHPHANQIGMIEIINQLTSEYGIQLMKNPSIKVNEKAVMIEPPGYSNRQALEDMQEAFEEITAWQLEIKENL